MEEVTINPTIEPPELTQNRGKQTLGGHKQNLVCPRTQEKGAVTPQETNPDMPVSPGVSRGGVGRQWPASWLETLSAATHAPDLLKEVTIVFMTSTIVWPQVKEQGGNTAPPINRKLD